MASWMKLLQRLISTLSLAVKVATDTVARSGLLADKCYAFQGPCGGGWEQWTLGGRRPSLAPRRRFVCVVARIYSNCVLETLHVHGGGVLVIRPIS